MADAPDSKSGRGNPVWVQVPPPAPSDYQPGHFSVLSRYPQIQSCSRHLSGRRVIRSSLARTAELLAQIQFTVYGVEQRRHLSTQIHFERR
jgi:hypothetical protein